MTAQNSKTLTAIRNYASIVAILVVVYGALSAYIYDKTKIAQNYERIKKNSAEITLLEKHVEMRLSEMQKNLSRTSEKTTLMFQEILIKLSRLETKVEMLQEKKPHG